LQAPIMTVPSTGGNQDRAQFYVRIGEEPYQTHQIVVVHPVNMKIPTEQGRKIELKGTSEYVALGGRSLNHVFYLQSWRYLEDAPSHRDREPHR